MEKEVKGVKMTKKQREILRTMEMVAPVVIKEDLKLLKELSKY